MPHATLDQLTASEIITEVITTLKTPSSSIQDFLGMNPGQGENVGGRNVGWDIYDKTRQVSNIRSPEMGPSTRAPQPVGHVSATMIRTHEKVPLTLDRLFRHRPLGTNIGGAILDSTGQKYLAKQQETIAQRFRNLREFVCAMMLRGKFRIRNQGDDRIPVLDTASTYNTEVDFQIPASHKDTCGGLLSGNWLTDAAVDVPGQILKLHAKSAEDSGWPIEHAWCNSTVYAALLNNTPLKNQAGTSNTVFEEYSRVPGTSPEGVRRNDFQVRFRAIPWLVWHIYDEVIVIDGTSVKFIPDERIIFTPEPSNSWVTMKNGSELILENRGAQAKEAMGLTAWVEQVTQPAGYELLAVDNFLPALEVPKAVWYADITN